MVNRIKALVVDDNSVSRFITVHLMEMLEIYTQEAENGNEAIERIQTESYDFILMDLIMPIMDGVETTNRIREREPLINRIPIIAISGNNILNEKEFLEINKMQAVLIKPLQLSALYDCICKQLTMDKKLQLSNRYLTMHTPGEDKRMQTLRQAFLKVPYCNYEEGLQYASGNIDQYLLLIRVTIKQLRESELKIGNYNLIHNVDVCIKECHDIKGALYYIGAKPIAELSDEVEHSCRNFRNQQDEYELFFLVTKQVQELVSIIHMLSDELEQALDAYNNNINESVPDACKQNYSLDEINEMIELILQHVKRFEYVEIMNGLQHLGLMTSKKNQSFVCQALMAAQEFNYVEIEHALSDFLKKNRGEAR